MPDSPHEKMPPQEGRPAERSARGMHDHAHVHPGEPPHRHPHHHEAGAEQVAEAVAVPVAHDHGHGMSFERYTWLCSPIHDMDPRVKTVAATLLIVTIVASGPPRPAELLGVATFLSAVTLTSRVPLRHVIARSLLVIPFAGMIALFAPLQASGGSLSVGGIVGAYGDGGWIAAYSILAKAWLATLTVTVLSVTTPIPKLFKGLEALKVPDVLLMLLSFMYRYADAMGAQLRSLRQALDSRGFALSRMQRVRLLGHLAGNLLVRAFDRGERIHAAMVSRGWTGPLPSADTLTLRPADMLAFVTVMALVAALLLY
ncbi:MAG: hypothetical protein Kow0056_10880 [Coriobacteriia bacterium]